MYTPAHFREDDLPTLHALMRQHSFATLVTAHDGRPFATHLPFLLDEARGPFGTLRAHMARANPQWRDLESGAEALVIFQGPHAYVSPSWYATAPNVPTWNYAAVHAYGTARLLGEGEMYALLRQSVAAYEAPQLQPWPFEAAPEDYTRRLMRGTVGFEIPIARLEGKLKMSQNKTPADRAGVVAALERSGDPNGLAVADWMRRLEDKQP